MTDSLERFLQDLHFEVPAGVVERAKAAAAVHTGESLAHRPGLGDTRRKFGREHSAVGRRTELAAAVAAVVIAAIVVGSFAYIRAVTRPHSVTPHITTPCPSPLLAPSPLPAQAKSSPTPLSQSLVCPGAPLILFIDPAAYQIDGMTWDGQRSGKVTEIPSPAQPVCQTTGTTQVCSPPAQRGGAPPLNSAQSSNPAGTMFVAFPYFYDRSGRVVATLNGGPYSQPGVGEVFFGLWADDEKHYCQVVPFFATKANGVSGTLQLTTPGGAARDVAKVGTVSSGVNNVTAVACSVQADRAVVVEVDPNGAPDGSSLVNQYWVVQLSTGRILWTHDVRGTHIAKVVASRDGRYVAELESSGATTIYGPTGSVVGHLSGSVQNFSWDGSVAVVYTPGGVSCHCSYGPVSLIRWGTGRVIWTAPAGDVLYTSQPEPGGGSLAIDTIPGNLPAHQMFETSDLYLISSDGQVLGKRVVGTIIPG